MNKIIKYESTIVFCIHVYVIKEQQTEVINIKCYHDNLHACKGINHEYPKSSFFYATCRSAISWEVPVLNQCTSDKKILIFSNGGYT